MLAKKTAQHMPVRAGTSVEREHVAKWKTRPFATQPSWRATPIPDGGKMANERHRRRQGGLRVLLHVHGDEDQCDDRHDQIDRRHAFNLVVRVKDALIERRHVGGKFIAHDESVGDVVNAKGEQQLDGRE